MASIGPAAPVGGAEAAEDLDGEPLEEAILRPQDCLVQQENRIDTEYKVGSLEVTRGLADLCAVVCIAYIAGKLLVAVPEEMGHRQLTRRRLPTRSLSRAVLCGVAACGASQRESKGHIVQEIKVWVGLLDKRLEEEILFLEDEKLTYHFGSVSGGDFLLPYGPALVEVANEHFAFVTAESGVPGEFDESGGPKVAERLDHLELTLAAMSANLAKLTGETGFVAPTGKQKSKPKKKIAQGERDQSEVQGMDAGTVKAALDAGVPMNHLQEMGKILRSRPARLDDVPRKPIVKKTVGELGETEEEEDSEGPELIPDGGGTAKEEPKNLEEAVLRLTQIASKLTQGQGEPKKDKLELILEGGGSVSSSGETTTAPGTRKNAAALRALQKMVREDPKYIYEHIEGNLQSDFLGRAPAPGEPWIQGTTVRGWLTARSRVQNYQQHVRWCWSLGGIWDALIAGRTSEARARCALLMAAADQASLDGGNWVMSTVSLLEPVPPYQAFSNHTSPAPGEMQHSDLYDVRWAEVFLTQLKEMDSFVDAKKKLSEEREGERRGSSEAERASSSKGKGKGSERERQRSGRCFRSGSKLRRPEEKEGGVKAGALPSEDTSRPNPLHLPGSTASVFTGSGTVQLRLGACSRAGAGWVLLPEVLPPNVLRHSRMFRRLSVSSFPCHYLTRRFLRGGSW